MSLTSLRCDATVTKIRARLGGDLTQEHLSSSLWLSGQFSLSLTSIAEAVLCVLVALCSSHPPGIILAKQI